MSRTALQLHRLRRDGPPRSRGRGPAVSERVHSGNVHGPAPDEGRRLLHHALGRLPAPPRGSSGDPKVVSRNIDRAVANDGPSLRRADEQVVPYRPTVPPPLFLQQAGPLQPSPHDALVPRLLHDASREAIHGATSRPLPPPLLVILYHLHNLASGMVAFARAFPYCRRKI